MNSSWIKGYGYIIKIIPLSLISLYQRLISPFFLPSCRFYPSCSSYAHLAIEKHGIRKGGLMSLLRVVKCHPFHPGGYDPVD